MADVVDETRRLVELLEAGDLDGAADIWSPQNRQMLVAYFAANWAPTLDETCGAGRRITEVWQLPTTNSVVRLRIEGESGSAIATFSFNREGRRSGYHVTDTLREGIFNIVIGTSREGYRPTADFYAALLGWKVVRQDWLKIARRRGSTLQLAFGDGWSNTRPPIWGDPDHPQQMHIDVVVPDLPAAAADAVRDGATELADGDGHRVLADPVGHPFCLREDTSLDEPVIGTVVFDCTDPAPMAAFWGALLSMDERVEERPDRVVIRGTDPISPMLGFQRIGDHRRPTWPGDDYPEQLHVDLSFDDRPAAQCRAEKLGATLLPPPHGSAPVYADPAGHPFCLGGQGE
jgi:hypothetical protein